MIDFEKIIGNIDSSLDSFAKITDNIRALVFGDESNKYEEENNIVSRALQRLQSGKSASIAVVGMTNAGKSTLINALFGLDTLEIKATVDTTKSIHKVEFPSGLIIYDTPGIFGDEKLENITRAFLGIKQISGKSISVTEIPFFEKDNISSIIKIEKIQDKAPIDLVLWVGDLSRTISRNDKKELRDFGQELYKKYSDRAIVAGTKLDVLRKLDKISDAEKEEIIKVWNEITDDNLIPISSVTGEGLEQLVLFFFQNSADNISFSKMQESLNVVRKLDRINFVSTQVSTILAKMVLLTGKQEKSITATSILIFTIICNQYSVDEETWSKYNGDAQQISNHLKEFGTNVQYEVRRPQSFWEHILSIFGRRFYNSSVTYNPIGFEGFQTIFPKIFELIYQFENDEQSPPDFNYEEKLKIHKKVIDKNVKNKNATNLTKIFYGILTALLNE